MTAVNTPLHDSLVRDQAIRYWQTPPSLRPAFTRDQLLWLSAAEWQHALDLVEPF